MDLFKPRGAAAPRRPTDNNQQNGQMINTPRFSEMGGLKNAAAAGGKNKMQVQKPGDGKRVIVSYLRGYTMSLEDLSNEARDELALLARQLAENPATRKDMLRLTKKIKPDMPIPELEIEDYTRSAMDKANERVEQLEARLREKDAMDELNKRRDKLKAKGLIDKDEDIDEVEKVMLEKGITNHEVAAEYWKWMQQSAAPTPTGYNPSAINKFDLSKYWKNPVAGARDEASKALMELRKNPRPIGL